jgi:hypothetical protein
VSPKGPIESLRVLGPRQLGYLDLIGSGIETAAHLKENGRIVLMLCAFEGAPRVVRFHGSGSIVERGEGAYADLFDRLGFSDLDRSQEAARAIVLVDVERIADSCGFGVPLLRYEGERSQHPAWVASKLRTSGQDAMVEYVAERNAQSIDGLPGLSPRPTRLGTAMRAR